MKQYKCMIEDLKTLCEDYLIEVETLGNECAYTDRILEDILHKALAIKETYDNDNKF